MTHLRVEIESLRIPVGHALDRRRVERALSAALSGEPVRTPGLTALERAVVTRVAAAVGRAVPPGTPAAMFPAAGGAVSSGAGAAVPSGPQPGGRPR